MNKENIKPYIICEFSEHPVFKEYTKYSLLEFDKLMETIDNRVHEKKEAREFVGYYKVWFRIFLPNGSEIMERQDIGDGNGGVIDFLKNHACYEKVASDLEKYKEEEKEMIKHLPDIKPGQLIRDIYHEQIENTEKIEKKNKKIISR